MLEIWAFLTRQKVVYLKDIDGEVSKTVAKSTPFGDVIAKRYWPMKIMIVTLKPGGTILPSCYVKQWCYPNGRTDSPIGNISPN